MKFLIITQKIDLDDGVLGFMHRWVEEFAKQSDKVVSICLKDGRHKFPENVTVRSLGKEGGISRLKYLYNFYKYVWRERNSYDAVFVHMNQIYVILGWPIWKLLGKKIGLWYAHGSVSFSLRVATFLADEIFTSTPSGFRLKSKKLHIVGQGIDTRRFYPAQKNFNAEPEFISVARISEAKGIDVTINALVILKANGHKFKMRFIGGAEVEKDLVYFQKMRDLVEAKGLSQEVEFLGTIANEKVIPYLQTATLFLNPSLTGSLDKSMLEAMACGTPTITCNESIKTVFHENKDLLGRFYFEKKNFTELSEKIENFLEISIAEKEKLSTEMRKIVENEHNVAGLISKIIKFYK